MNILFVEPVIVAFGATFVGKLVTKIYTSNSLTYQQLAAVTPKKHNLKLVDERFEKINYNEDCDVVAISSTTYYANHVYEIADQFRKHGKIVVLGGSHPSGLPEDAKQHADSVVIGEGEILWPKVLEDIENDNLKPFYKQDKPVDPEIIPSPDRKLVKKSFFIARVQATRGCPNKCNFCAIKNIDGNYLRKRSIEKVINEIKSIPQKFLIFADASLTLDPEYTKELFRNMIGLKKKFSCCGNADVLAKDEELLELAKKAGCIAWQIGFESFCQETLENIGKKTNKVAEYKMVIDKVHKYKMAVIGSFIFGFDEEDLEYVKKSLKMLDNLKVDLVEFGILTPFPGTPLWDQMEKEGRILTKNWAEYYEGKVVFKPKNMTPEELYEKSYQVFWKYNNLFFSYKRIIHSMKLGFYPFIWTFMHSVLWV